MRRRAESRPAGFVLPVVLGILLATGLLAVQLASDLASQRTLATHRQLQQHAFEAAEYGITHALATLAGGAVPPAVEVLALPGTRVAQVQVQWRLLRHDTLPAGNSAGRVSESWQALRSTGTSARGTRVTLVQGVRQQQWLGP